MKIEIAGIESVVPEGEIVEVVFEYKGRVIRICVGELSGEVESGVVNHWSGEREGVHMMNMLIDGEQALSLFAANSDTFKCESPVGIEVMDGVFDSYNTDGCTHDFVAKG